MIPKSMEDIDTPKISLKQPKVKQPKVPKAVTPDKKLKKTPSKAKKVATPVSSSDEESFIEIPICKSPKKETKSPPPKKSPSPKKIPGNPTPIKKESKLEPPPKKGDKLKPVPKKEDKPKSPPKKEEKPVPKKEEKPIRLESKEEPKRPDSKPKENPPS